MLTSLRIQNFRSIRDASVKLGQVTLFIGPNNSGKSNFLKGVFEITTQIMRYPIGSPPTIEWYEQSLPRWTELHPLNPTAICLYLVDEQGEQKSCTVDYSVAGKYAIRSKEVVEQVKAVAITGELQDVLDLSGAKPDFMAFPTAFYAVRKRLENCVVFKQDPNKFQLSARLTTPQTLLDADGANIVGFIFNLREKHRKLYERLEKDFALCVGTLETISTPLNPAGDGLFKLSFSDFSGQSYWAEEVSEGVLYFLALLCVVHQPNPPKLLLLEEPEKGIHPRRIKEVMEFIFELAYLRDIQIILTSHSPYVVDHFKDIPECISIFDRDPKTGETLVKNAAEYIEQTNAELVKNGFEEICYTDSLGENWVSGFLGGVPLNNL